MIGGMANVRTSDKLATWIHAACVLEAAARKPGNVHPDASFADLCFADFVRAAEVVAPILARTVKTGVGQAVLAAIRETQRQVGTNANLGIVLLLAPLAAVPLDTPLRKGVCDVLAKLSQRDAELVYEAIRLAHPGGMGQVREQDISRSPTVSLTEAMALAADRDLIARQYVTDFCLVLDEGAGFLASVGSFTQRAGGNEFTLRGWEQAVIELQLRLLSRHRDSLIERKCGVAIAVEASERAQAVVDSGWPHAPGSDEKLSAFDAWLRADGHRRNPGTTADLIAASLFAAFREGRIELPDVDSLSLGS